MVAEKKRKPPWWVVFLLTLAGVVCAGAIIGFFTMTFTAPTKLDINRVEIQSIERDANLDKQVEETRLGLIEAGKVAIETTKGMARLQGYLEAKEKK